MPQHRHPQRRSPAPAAPPDAVSPWVALRSATFHPFIFQRMLRSADPAARPGDIVQVYDRAGQLFGRGLYNPRSQIALRMLAHGAAPIDDAFWRDRLQTAVELRSRLGLSAATDAYRLVHAEGDGLSGLIVERFADCIVFELFSLGMFQRCGGFAAILADLLGPPSALDRPDRAAAQWRIVVRADRQVESFEGFKVTADTAPPGAILAGDAASETKAVAPLVIREHGIRYRVDLTGGHKTGFFCDQRDNRRRLATFCRDANVLDLCCYTGGFGLCARVLGGARNVTSVDLDETALAVARDNLNLNQVRNELVHADAFVYLRQMLANQRQFDVVVLDPPKLALSRDPEEFDEALRKYHDLNALGIGVVRPGGLLLTCSCSGLVSQSTFLEIVQRASRRSGRNLQLLDFTGAAPDHPVMLTCPESAYLKAAWLRVL